VYATWLLRHEKDDAGWRTHVSVTCSRRQGLAWRKIYVT